MREINVIIPINKGIADTPLVINGNTRAEAYFRDLAISILVEEGYGEEDYYEITRNMIDYGYICDKINKMLELTRKKILWFTDLEIK